MTIQDQRRKAFEEWLDSAGFDVRRYHHIPGYHGNEQMAAWEAWNAALDSLEVELPPQLDADEVAEHFAIDDEGLDMAVGITHMVNGAIMACAAAIHAAGVKTK